MMSNRIAIVEDDGVLAFMMDETCKSAGYDVVGCASTAVEAIALIDKTAPDLLVLDFNLDGAENGLELIGAVKRSTPSIKTVLVTGWDINDIAARVDSAQPDRILRKPVMPHTLVDVIRHLLAPDEGDESPAPASTVGRSH